MKGTQSLSQLSPFFPSCVISVWVISPQFISDTWNSEVYRQISHGENGISPSGNCRQKTPTGLHRIGLEIMINQWVLTKYNFVSLIVCPLQNPANLLSGSKAGIRMLASPVQCLGCCTYDPDRSYDPGPSRVGLRMLVSSGQDLGCWSLQSLITWSYLSSQCGHTE